MIATCRGAALLVVVAAACQKNAGPGPPATNPDWSTLIGYDRSAPLDLRDSVIQVGDGLTIHDLTYASPRGGRVPAFLVRPTKPGRYPAVLFGHWGNGNRSEFLPEAKLLARLGAVSLLIDYPWVRPAAWRRDEGPLVHPEIDRDVRAQAVVDLRRGLDLLAARADVDSLRLGYIGHSFGAQWGANLAEAERRLIAVVLMAGVPDGRALLLDSEEPALVEYRKRWTQSQLDRYLDVNGPLDAIRHVGNATPTPLLLQFARFEAAIPMAANHRYAAAASEPKTVLWYDTGHELNDPQALFDRVVWLGRRLGFAPLGPEIERMIGACAR